MNKNIHKPKKFLTDVVLESESICNLKEETETLTQVLMQGKRIVFSGRRNMGKTSLIQGKVIPNFSKKQPNTLILYADLMGVRNLDELAMRLQKAFEAALSKVKPSKHLTLELMKTFKRIRPQWSMDSLSGVPEFSLGLSFDEQPIDLEKVISEIGKIHKKSGAAIILDEFQDIVTVDQAQEKFRSSLQLLPGDLPVILMGSKKHILAKIFALPKAPLANWGRYIEISNIKADEYLPYMNERFKQTGISIDIDVVEFLLKKMSFVPESINLICEWVTRHVTSNKKISLVDIKLAIRGVVTERKSLYREFLLNFTSKEELFLTSLARVQPLAQPHSKQFLRLIGMSPGGSKPLLNRLEDQAVIYREEEGYIISDPLLAEYLRK